MSRNVRIPILAFRQVPVVKLAHAVPKSALPALDRGDGSVEVSSQEGMMWAARLHCREGRNTGSIRTHANPNQDDMSFEFISRQLSKSDRAEPGLRQCVS